MLQGPRVSIRSKATCAAPLCEVLTPCRGLRADPGSVDSASRICPGQSSQHDADHREANEGGNGSSVALEISHEAAKAAEPCDRALDNPSFRQNLEAWVIGAIDDFDLPRARSSGGLRRLWAAIATISEDAFDERKQTTSARIKNKCCTVPILDMGGMDCNTQQQAERVDENVSLAARDLLACIEALRIERGPPFCAALALWLSMIAVVGLAWRPACSRTAT
jgi:hypothetical protein